MQMSADALLDRSQALTALAEQTGRWSRKAAAPSRTLHPLIAPPTIE
jgi:hypothetical protein